MVLRHRGNFSLNPPSAAFAYATRHTHLHTYPNCYDNPAHQLISTAHECTWLDISQPTRVLFRRQLLDFHPCRPILFPSLPLWGHHPLTLPLRHSHVFLQLLLHFPPVPSPPFYPTWVIRNEQWYTNPSSEERAGRKLHCRWGMVFRREWDPGRTDPLGPRSSKARRTKAAANRINN